MLSYFKMKNNQTPDEKLIRSANRFGYLSSLLNVVVAIFSFLGGGLLAGMLSLFDSKVDHDMAKDADASLKNDNSEYSK